MTDHTAEIAHTRGTPPDPAGLIYAVPCGECEDGCLHGTTTPCPRCHGRLATPVDLAGYIRDARSAANPCEHRYSNISQPAVCSPCLRDRLLPIFAQHLGVAIRPGAGS